MKFANICSGCVLRGAECIVQAIGCQLHYSNARPTRRREFAAEDGGIEKLRRSKKCRFRNGFQVRNPM